MRIIDVVDRFHPGSALHRLLQPLPGDRTSVIVVEGYRGNIFEVISGVSVPRAAGENVEAYYLINHVLTPHGHPTPQEADRSGLRHCGLLHALGPEQAHRIALRSHQAVLGATVDDVDEIFTEVGKRISHLLPVIVGQADVASTVLGRSSAINDGSRPRSRARMGGFVSVPFYWGHTYIEPNPAEYHRAMTENPLGDRIAKIIDIAEEHYNGGYTVDGYNLHEEPRGDDDRVRVRMMLTFTDSNWRSWNVDLRRARNTFTLKHFVASGAAVGNMPDLGDVIAMLRAEQV